MHSVENSNVSGLGSGAPQQQQRPETTGVHSHFQPWYSALTAEGLVEYSLTSGWALVSSIRAAAEQGSKPTSPRMLKRCVWPKCKLMLTPAYAEQSAGHAPALLCLVNAVRDRNALHEAALS